MTSSIQTDICDTCAKVFHYHFIYALLMIICVLFFNITPARADKSPYDWALIQLDYILKEKTDHLARFIKKIHQTAEQARNDRKVISFFEMNRLYYNACRSQQPPPSLTRDIQQMREHFNTYYIERYFCFYDMLFVDDSGHVFYTLRKEMDACMDILQGKNTLGPLQEIMKTRPSNEMFVDYYDYPPSSEPAAFFIEPIKTKGQAVGWLILQCPVNALNSIFSATDDLGHTGETFLVNNTGLMLTESHFKGQSTILKERLDDRNIKAKFAEKKGHRTVTDYREKTALSSFEVFEFMDTQWLVVAKIDKNEITTRHFSQHNRYYSDQLVNWIRHHSPATSKQTEQGIRHSRILRVDMDEFLKAENNELLETWGISTCTAMLATVPGKFAYLAHISPKDKIYSQSDTHLLSQITKKMKNFDIYPYEQRNVQFMVIAPHFDSLGNVINQLIEDGFLLSQIQIGYHPHAQSAAVTFDYRLDRLNITWSFEKPKKPPVFQNINVLYNAGTIIETIMTAESGGMAVSPGRSIKTGN